MSKTPLVSVVICVYNAGRYLRLAVQSILDQTYQNLEILVIDDGSTDGCMATIADLTDSRIRIVGQENQGKPVALNRALDEMRGEYYAIQDADDLSHPTRIERQVRCMQENPDVAAVFCGHELILGNRCLAPRFRAKDAGACRRDIEQMRMPAHDPTAMYRCSLVKRVRYETALRIGQGYDYILRVGEQYPMLVLGECLYVYRAHETSATRISVERREGYVRQVIERAQARRGIHIGQTPARPARYRRHAGRDNNLAAHFIESALDLRRAGRWTHALTTGLQCSCLHPLDPHYHKAWVLAATPRFMHRYLRRSAATP